MLLRLEPPAVSGSGRFEVRWQGVSAELAALGLAAAAYRYGPMKYEPFALSLSKGFDKLNPNGN